MSAVGRVHGPLRSAGTLFYLDPPYYGGERDYGAGMFEREEYAKMVRVPEMLKGRFILSINEVPAIRDMTPMKLTYNVARASRSTAAELIIKG